MTTQDSTTLFFVTAIDGGQRLLVDRDLVAGRDPACDLVLDQGQASRRHAKISPTAGGVLVEDLGSTNGTLVNGNRIDAPTLVKAGDTFQIGKIRFNLEAQAPVTAAPVDPNATLLFTPETDGSVTPSASTAETQPEPASPAKPAESIANPEPAKDASTAAAKQSPAPRKVDEASADDSKAPPSWVLNNQQSVDGTKFISKDIMQDVLSNSAAFSAQQESVSEPTLIGNTDPVVGMRFQLIGEGRNQWEIGRSPNSDVMLNHESVSSSHAQVIHEGKRWKLVDLMSANGTYVNGKKCLTGYLASGDLVRFGHVECTFLLAGDTARSEFGSDRSDTEVDIPAAGSGGMKTAAIAFGITAAVAGAVLYVISQYL